MKAAWRMGGKRYSRDRWEASDSEDSSDTAMTSAVECEVECNEVMGDS